MGTFNYAHDPQAYFQLFQTLRNKSRALGLRFESNGTLDYTHYNDGAYTTMRIAPYDEAAYDSVALLVAGFHGEEQEGPLAIRDYFEEIYSYAEDNGVCLITYPCVNPTGFIQRNRHSIEYQIEQPWKNNDFLRYVFDDGSVHRELLSGESCDLWYMSSDSELQKILAARPNEEQIYLLQETQLMHSALNRDFENHGAKIKTLIDLHQDYIVDVANTPFSYVYTFGDTTPYLTTAQEVDKLVPLLRNHRINSGQTEDFFFSDNNGFLFRHEGSIEDFMWRKGVPHILCVETTGATDAHSARKVNLLWTKCGIDCARK